MFLNPYSLNITEKDSEFWELVLTKFITLTPLGISVFSWVKKSTLRSFYLWTLNPLIKRKWSQWLFETNSFIYLCTSGSIWRPENVSGRAAGLESPRVRGRQGGHSWPHSSRSCHLYLLWNSQLECPSGLLVQSHPSILSEQFSQEMFLQALQFVS